MRAVNAIRLDNRTDETQERGMTSIVGIETPRGVMLASDSLGANEQWTATIRAESKVFSLGAYVLGFTSSFRMGDILRYQVALPGPPRTRVHKHLVTKVVPVIRDAFKAHGFGTTKEGADHGGEFLVGVRGELYSVSDDYQVGRIRERRALPHRARER